MSVAFRRESDEEHKEPRFELPLPPGPNLVTAAGVALIETRVTDMEGLLAGDLSEEARADAQRNLRYWLTRRATAQLAPIPDDEEVAFGSRVRVRMNGKTREIDIVGDDESDPAADRIAFSAPLARALIGRAEGERVDFGGKPGAIEILDTRPIPTP